MKDFLPILRLTALLLFVVGTSLSTYFYIHPEKISIWTISGAALLILSPILTKLLWFLVRFWRRPLFTGTAVLKEKHREQPVDPKMTRIKWSSDETPDSESTWHTLIIIFEEKEYSIMASGRSFLYLSEGDTVVICYRRSRIGSTIDVTLAQA